MLGALLLSAFMTCKRPLGVRPQPQVHGGPHPLGKLLSPHGESYLSGALRWPAGGRSAGPCGHQCLCSEPPCARVFGGWTLGRGAGSGAKCVDLRGAAQVPPQSTSLAPHSRVRSAWSRLSDSICVQRCLVFLFLLRKIHIT